MPDPAGLLTDDEEERVRRWQAGAGGLLSIGAGLMGYGADTRNPAPLMAGIAGFQDALRGAVADRQAAERAKYMRALTAQTEAKTAAEVRRAQAEQVFADRLSGAPLTAAASGVPQGDASGTSNPLDMLTDIQKQTLLMIPDPKQRIETFQKFMEANTVSKQTVRQVGDQLYSVDPLTNKATLIQTPPGARKPNDPINVLETEVRSAKSAMDRFEQVITENKGGSFDTYINNPQSPQAQKVLSAYQSMVMALRSEAFMNTGVLQPAEMKMLENNLLSPETMRGALASPDAYKAKLDEYRGYMDNKIRSAYETRGLPMPEGLKLSREAPQGQQGQQGGTGQSSGNLLDEARDAISRGADPAKVMQRLRSRGIDPGGL